MSDNPLVLPDGIHEVDVADVRRAGIGYDVWLAYRLVKVNGDWRGAYGRLRYVFVTARYWRRRSWWKAWAAEAPDSLAGAGGWTRRGTVRKLRRKLDAETS